LEFEGKKRGRSIRGKPGMFEGPGTKKTKKMAKRKGGKKRKGQDIEELVIRWGTGDREGKEKKMKGPSKNSTGARLWAITGKR